MSSISRQNMQNILLYCAAIVFFAGIREISPESKLVGMITALGYIMLILVWGYSVLQRIPTGDMKRWLLLSDLFMLLWIFLRVMKYWYFYEPWVQRHLWYSFYVPQILIPLFVFYSALRTGRKNQKFSGKWYLLYISAAVLIGGILTNDLHQKAFQFQRGFVDWKNKYTYGFVYFTVMLWLFGLFIASVCILFFKSRIPQSRKRIWMPFIWLPMAVSYGLYYMKGPLLLPRRPLEMPEAICFMIISLLECCIQTGLIPSNVGYSRIFMTSSISAQIVDDDGKLAFASQNVVPLSEQQKNEAKEKELYLDEDTILHSGKIHGGRVYWSDDIGVINRLNRRLAEIGEELSSENELLKAENRLKEQKASIAQQTQLYNSITAKVRPQLEKIDDLISDLSIHSPDFQKNMELACVLNAYIKRRSNLVLLSAKEKELPLEELALCIRESADYLKQAGVLCSFWQTGQGFLPSDLAELLYERFQNVVEAVLPGLSVLMVTLGVEKGAPFLKLAMEGPEKIPDIDGKGLKIQTEIQDGTIFLKFLGKGGDSN